MKPRTLKWDPEFSVSPGPFQGGSSGLVSWDPLEMSLDSRKTLSLLGSI